MAGLKHRVLPTASLTPTTLKPFYDRQRRLHANHIGSDRLVGSIGLAPGGGSFDLLGQRQFLPGRLVQRLSGTFQNASRSLSCNFRPAIRCSAKPVTRAIWFSKILNQVSRFSPQIAN